MKRHWTGSGIRACLLIFIMGSPCLPAQEGVLGVVPTGVGPVSVALDPAADEAYVVISGSQEVLVLDLKSRAVKTRYAVGGFPEGIAFNPRTRAIVVACRAGKVTTIDHAAGRLGVPLSVGKAPMRVVIDAEKNVALVTDFVGGSLFVIDLAAQKITETIDLKNSVLGVALLGGKRRAVVACQYDMELIQVNLDSQAVEKEFLVGRYHSEVVVNPASGRIVLVSPSSAGVPAILDPEENVILSTIPMGAGPLSVAIYARRNVALVREYNAGTISLVDLEKGSLISSIRVAEGPSGLAVHPESGIAVVANKLANSVTFLDVDAILKAAPAPAAAPETKPAAPVVP